MIKLNMGCSNKMIKGFINVDLRPDLKEECSKNGCEFLNCDMRKLPYVDGEVDEIVAYQSIEHVMFHDLMPMLREWNRVLKNKGKLTITTPNLLYIAWSITRGKEIWTALMLIFGRTCSHKAVYTPDYLWCRLNEAGFAIKNVEMGWEHSEMKFEAYKEVFPISLYNSVIACQDKVTVDGYLRVEKDDIGNL